jgi:hypothetical protein
MKHKKTLQKLLFLQLPRLENDMAPGENLSMASRYLFYALERAGLSSNCQSRWLTPEEEELDDRPPYGVRSTSTMSSEDILALEEVVHRKSPLDCITEKFVGIRLADLFNERITLDLSKDQRSDTVPGITSRRALVFKAPSLYARRKTITGIVRKAITSEPNMLWQFVLQPEREEPLDLLDAVIAEIRRWPYLWMDRFASVRGWDRIASKRVCVLLKPQGRYSSSWLAAAEALLEDHFY